MYARAGAVLFALVAAQLAGGADDDAVKKEKAKLQGTWVPEYTARTGQTVENKKVKVTVNGKEMEIDSKVTHRAIVIDADTIAPQKLDAADQPQPPAKYTIDPTKTPKHIDVDFTTKDGKKLVAKGIYKFDGDDTLMMSVRFGPAAKKDSPPGADDRPTKFDDENNLNSTFKRKK